ncbi:hypothetical protein ACGFMM_01265 [Streptomyces sp. NPDC048604]|uniref:hypothetical protein n=1 Tax=Streptomyces sp. NPDC048604 TaxID=3365578 RepID=UPI003714D148
MRMGQKVTGHINNRELGRVEFTGTVVDIYTTNGQSMVTVACADGVERYALEGNVELVKEPPAPEWRTLKGVATPFLVQAEAQENGRVYLARDRKQVTGQPVKVVRLEIKASCRYGYTETGARVDFVGVATKAWVTQL